MTTHLHNTLSSFALSLMLLSNLNAIAQERPSDTTISFWVAEAFSENPRITTTQVDIQTSEGIVTLNGKVGSLAGKNYAGNEARKINGVLGVINNLVVEGPQRSEEDLLIDIQRRLAEYRTPTSSVIGVHFINGIITLTGEVASWSERQEVELRVSQVPGVKQLRNELTILPRSPRTDGEIERDVLILLDRDIYLSGLPISASVRNGIVILEGRVGNAYQKERAGRVVLNILYVKGVDNKLTVQWWQENSPRRILPTPSNQELQESVRRALQQHVYLDSSRLLLKVDQGVVTLSGSVPSYYQAQLAEQLAREIIGVGWVLNDLKVDVENRSDEAIGTDVRRAVNLTTYLDSQNIKIYVQGGTVILAGSVNTLYEKTQVMDVIAPVRGIRQVVNNLTVNPSGVYTDAVLEGRIRTHLEANWATRWVADRITISVTDATVTLTGSVNTWGQRSEADRVALLTEGTREVNNRITVIGADYTWSPKP